MRRVRFEDPGGRIRKGDWTETGIKFGGRTYDPTAVNVLPPSNPSKIVGVSTNHIEAIEQYDLGYPDRPKIFLKTPNAISGHGDRITLLPDKELHYEGELAVVIGEQCRNVDAAAAMDVVAGFTCVNDITNYSDRDTYGVRFKSFDNAAVVGPVIAPVNAVPSDARIQLRVNGETKQDASREGLRFEVPEVIEEITAYMTLERGDIIPLGTPGNVGELRGGDAVEIEIEGVGTLTHGVERPQ